MKHWGGSSGLVQQCCKENTNNQFFRENVRIISSHVLIYMSTKENKYVTEADNGVCDFDTKYKPNFLSLMSSIKVTRSKSRVSAGV